ncbi:MAG: hypothetical protein ABIQ30_01735 [Devosia sp.]
MGVIEKIAIDNATLAKLTANAKRHGRTVEQEAAEALRIAIRTPSREEIVARFEAIAAMTPKGVTQTDSTLLIREDRDR